MFEFKLTQNGRMVAGSFGLTRADAHREIFHYALTYAQDGPVEVWERLRGRWKLITPKLKEGAK